MRHSGETWETNLPNRTPMIFVKYLGLPAIKKNRIQNDAFFIWLTCKFNFLDSHIIWPKNLNCFVNIRKPHYFLIISFVPRKKYISVFIPLKFLHVLNSGKFIFLFSVFNLIRREIFTFIYPSRTLFSLLFVSAYRFSRFSYYIRRACTYSVC